jgi:hypothetical protein
MTRPSLDETRAPAAVTLKPPDAPPPSWIEKFTPIHTWWEGPWGRLTALHGSVIKTITPATDWLGQGFEIAAQFPETAVATLTPSDQWCARNEAAAAALEAFYATTLVVFYVLANSGYGFGR